MLPPITCYLINSWVRQKSHHEVIVATTNLWWHFMMSTQDWADSLKGQMRVRMWSLKIKGRAKMGNVVQDFRTIEIWSIEVEEFTSFMMSQPKLIYSRSIYYFKVLNLRHYNSTTLVTVMHCLWVFQFQNAETNKTWEQPLTKYSYNSIQTRSTMRV